MAGSQRRQFPGARMLWADSRGLEALPLAADGTTFEFVHVDADHSYGGCTGDLGLATRARWILVDDFDVGPEVRAACRDFLLGGSGAWAAAYIPDGFRGNLLLTRQA